jgi:hypothetical protein
MKYLLEQIVLDKELPKDNTKLTHQNSNQNGNSH